MKIESSLKKVAIIGSRSCLDKQLVFDFLDKNRDKIELIVSGGANGPDSFAQQWAKERGFAILIFYPRWRDENGVFDRGAGFRRNAQIVEHCDIVIAFMEEKGTAGTKNTISIAEMKRKPVKIISFVPQPELPSHD